MIFTNKNGSITIEGLDCDSEYVTLNMRTKTFRCYDSDKKAIHKSQKKMYEKIKAEGIYCTRCRRKNLMHHPYKLCLQCLSYARKTTPESILNGTWVPKKRGRKSKS